MKLRLLATCIFIMTFTLQVNLQQSDYKVVCYYNYWSNDYVGDGKFRVENIDSHLCTHLVYAYAGINDCYEVYLPRPQLQEETGEDDLNRFLKLREQNPNLKLVIAIGGYTQDYENFAKMVMERHNRKYFINSIMDFLRDYSFDGLSIDWHYLSKGSAECHQFMNFVEDVKEIFKVNNMTKLIAVTASGDVDSLQRCPFHIVLRVDWIGLVTYDYNGPTWSNNKTGLVAPLYGRSDDPRSLNHSLREITQGFEEKNILLGMPTFGRSFRLADKNQTRIGAPTNGSGEKGPFTETPGLLGYNEIADWITKSRVNWSFIFDEEQKVPYAYYDDHWISFENEESFRLKAEYIKEKKIGGAMIRSLDLDDFHGKKTGIRFPLISTVSKILLGYKPQTTPTPIPPTFKCKKEGLFMDFSNCTKFFQCAPGNPIPYHLFCPREPQLYFSEKHCRCEWESNAQDCLKPQNGNIETNGCSQ